MPTNLRQRASLLLLFMAVTTLMAGPAEDKAAATGQVWLSLLDSGKYEESWKQSAAMFQSEVPQDSWVAALKRTRQPMGDLISRSIARVDFTNTLRGAPEGDYSIIHFSAAFKNKEAVTERLTLVRENGEWKMAAYAIH